jgi:16S rRNA (cytosine1402-N4)-methyltransferase
MLPNVLQPSATDHVPVLANEVRESLAVRPGDTVVDATFGAGGHAALLADDLHGRGKLIAIDRDPTVRTYFERLERRTGVQARLLRGDFGVVLPQLAENGVRADAVLLDLGVSSMQLDTPERGFSFRHDGPLDMRMGRDGPSAADILAVASERDLADIIFNLGEERHSRAVARAIVAARQRSPIVTTGALADIVGRVVHGRPGDIHPATRTFQALRLFVNDELHELEGGLAAAERILRPGGRLVVVSFHSLEDRIVKTFLATRSRPSGGSRHLPEKTPQAATFEVLTRRPVTPDAAEIHENPRARSAKLRAAQRTDAPPRTAAGVPAFPGVRGRAGRGVPSLAAILQGNH